MRLRENFVKVMLTDAERRMLEVLARGEGLTMSDFLRLRIRSIYKKRKR